MSYTESLNHQRGSTIIVIVVIFALLVLIGLCSQSQRERIDSHNQYQAPPSNAPYAPESKPSQPSQLDLLEQYPSRYIKVVRQSWYKGGFETVAIHTVTLKNESDFDVKDITMKFTYEADSGTEVGSHIFTLYKVLPKKKKKTFGNLNVGFIDAQASRGGVDEILKVEIIR